MYVQCSGLVRARISGLHVERCKVELKVELKVVRSEKMAKWPLEEYEDASEVVNLSAKAKIWFHNLFGFITPHLAGTASSIPLFPTLMS